MSTKVLYCGSIVSQFCLCIRWLAATIWQLLRRITKEGGEHLATLAGAPVHGDTALHNRHIKAKRI